MYLIVGMALILLFSCSHDDQETEPLTSHNSTERAVAFNAEQADITDLRIGLWLSTEQFRIVVHADKNVDFMRILYREVLQEETITLQQDIWSRLNGIFSNLRLFEPTNFYLCDSWQAKIQYQDSSVYFPCNYAKNEDFDLLVKELIDLSPFPMVGADNIPIYSDKVSRYDEMSRLFDKYGTKYGPGKP